MKKKILFLNFAYPYGHFGPSSNCTCRIMERMAENKQHGIYNISCDADTEDKSHKYKIIEGVRIYTLPFAENLKKHSRFYELLMLVLKIPIYPLYNILKNYKYYKACKELLRNEKFDIVVAQCYPQESVITGTLLKKYGQIDRLVVLFWDNIYGKLPRRIIPQNFALKRQRRLEGWIAKYADKLVTPSAVKSFHDTFGDVAAALGKRVYLDHPSVIRPSTTPLSLKKDFIKSDKINLLYSGRCYSVNHLAYCISLLNKCHLSENMNLIFLCKGISETEFAKITNGFKGSATLSGWIPVDDLLALYKEVDCFMSFGGNPTQVTSKVYEYMSNGKPILHFYEFDNDVNVSLFARYLYFKPIDVKRPVEDTIPSVEDFFASCLGRKIDFEEVEKLFPTATASAYIELIDKILEE